MTALNHNALSDEQNDRARALSEVIGRVWSSTEAQALEHFLVACQHIVVADWLADEAGERRPPVRAELPDVKLELEPARTEAEWVEIMKRAKWEAK